MAHPEVFAWRWKETLAVGTGSRLQLLFAGGRPKIGSRPAHIMDITLEIRFSGKDFCLLQNGLMASGLDDPSLMEGQGTETASPKAGIPPSLLYIGCQVRI